MSGLDRLSVFFKRVRDLFPWTWLGLGILGLSSLSLIYLGWAELDHVALILAYIGLAILGIETLVVSIAALMLRTRLIKESERASAAGSALSETGRWMPTGFKLSSWSWIPLVQWWWAWEDPSDVVVRWQTRQGQRHEYVWFKKRRELFRIERRLVVQDPFGLVRFAFRHGVDLQWRVLPHRGRIAADRWARSLAAGEERPHPMGLSDGDRTEIRRYVPGDPARLIHWKVFGRTRKLMVRMPERAMSPARKVHAYLLAGKGDEASAAAARVVIEDELLGEDWRFSAEGISEVAGDRVNALRMIVQSASDTEVSGSGLANFVEHIQRQGPAGYVIFAPPYFGPWVNALIRLAAGAPFGVRVIIGIEGASETPKTKSWFKRPTPASSESQQSIEVLQELVSRLTHAGCEVVVVDRRSGRQFRGMAGAKYLPKVMGAAA